MKIKLELINDLNIIISWFWVKNYDNDVLLKLEIVVLISEVKEGEVEGKELIKELLIINKKNNNEIKEFNDEGKLLYIEDILEIVKKYLMEGVIIEEEENDNDDYESMVELIDNEDNIDILMN